MSVAKSNTIHEFIENIQFWVSFLNQTFYKELKEFYCDLLYKLELAGDDGFIYILFEHKSYRDKLTPLQLLEYMLKIWRLFLKQNTTERLPIIIPLVLYHGPSGRSSADTCFSRAIRPVFGRHLFFSFNQRADRGPFSLYSGFQLCIIRSDPFFRRSDQGHGHGPRGHAAV